MTTNLTTKREELEQDFRSKFKDRIDTLEAFYQTHGGDPWDGPKLKDWLPAALQSYGEEVAKQTREKVIEECINDFDNEFWKAEFERGSTTLHSNVLISLDQLRSTQPKEKSKLQSKIQSKSDLEPFEHGEEGTHFSCDLALVQQLGCCACNRHSCLADKDKP